MSHTYQELMTTLDQLRAEFARWREEGRITEQQEVLIAEIYNKWVAELNPELDYSSVLPPARDCSPDQLEAETRRRQLVFAEQEVRRQGAQQRLTMGQVQSLVADLRQQLGGVEKQFGGAGETKVAPSDAPKGRSLVEYLLDPRSLQALMATGGALLMLGLVIWLWSVGVFKNPLTVALTMGAANLAVLGAGAAMVRYSRYQTAGRAMTLLACLVLPLNLWFYDVQGLVTMRDGGHLWVAAVICCTIYAGVARLLKDATFVYALVAGVAMTGLMFLAEEMDRFWEVLAPSTFLVLLGVVCVHAERLFHQGEGPFGRDNFGRAFFLAGHVVMAMGLMVLLGGRLVGDFYEPLFAGHVDFAQPSVATETGAKLTALLLALLGTYTYAYSQIVVSPKVRRYAYSSVIALVWSEVILLDLLAVPATECLWMIVLASTGLLAYVATTFWNKKSDPVDHLSGALGSVGASTGAAALWGMVALVRGLLIPENLDASFQFEPLYGVAMAMTAAAALLAARVWRGRGRNEVATWWNQTAALALVAVVATVATLAGLNSLTLLLPILMLAPMALEATARMSDSESPLANLTYGAYAATMFLLVVSLAAVTGVVDADHALTRFDHLTLAAFYAAAAGLLAGGSLRNRTLLPSITAGLSGCAAVWQLLAVLGFVEYAPILAASIVGLAIMAFARHKQSGDGKASTMSTVGAVIVTLGAASGLLMTLGRVLGGDPQYGLVGLAICQGVAAVVASLLMASKDWKTTSRTLAGLHVLAAVVVINVLSQLTMWERGELIVVAAGTMLLVAGHIRWRREGEIRDPAVDLHIVAGSLLTAVPLVLGLLAQRFGGYEPATILQVFNELGALVAGLALLGAGVLCRMRATTFVGASSLAAWVVSLIALVKLPELQGAAIYMMIGGGLFFAVAVLLSVYRDRLLALPEKVKNREGMFRVLDWR